MSSHLNINRLFFVDSLSFSKHKPMVGPTCREISV